MDKGGSAKVESLESSAQQICDILGKAKTMNEVMAVKGQLDELHMRLHEGMEWWPQYDIRRGQETVQMVERSIDSARKRIQPRRRFRFTSTSRANEKATSCKIEENKEEINDNSDNAKKHQALNPSYEDNSIEEGHGTAGATQGRVVILEVNGATAKISSGETSGRAVVVNGSGEGVHVVLSDDALSVRVSGLKHCIIDTGVVSGPVWVSQCSSCAVYSDCRQLRMHDSQDCTLRVCVRSSPIIERCHDIRIGPIHYKRNTELRTPDTEATEEANTVNENRHYEGRWRDVIDMSWLRESKSSNWRFLTDNDDDSLLIGRQI